MTTHLSTLLPAHVTMMCKGIRCGARTSCLRYRATPATLQDFMEACDNSREWTEANKRYQKKDRILLWTFSTG